MRGKKKKMTLKYPRAIEYTSGLFNRLARSKKIKERITYPLCKAPREGKSEVKKAFLLFTKAWFENQNRYIRAAHRIPKNQMGGGGGGKMNLRQVADMRREQIRHVGTRHVMMVHIIS